MRRRRQPKPLDNKLYTGKIEFDNVTKIHKYIFESRLRRLRARPRGLQPSNGSAREEAPTIRLHAEEAPDYDFYPMDPRNNKDPYYSVHGPPKSIFSHMDLNKTHLWEEKNINLLYGSIIKDHSLGGSYLILEEMRQENDYFHPKDPPKYDFLSKNFLTWT